MEQITRAKAVYITLFVVLIAYISIYPILVFSDLSLDWWEARYLFAFLGGTVLLAAYAGWRGMIIIPEAICCFSAVLALSVPILVWTYAAMRLNMPLADAQLAGMDEALGFDWRAFIAFVDSRPQLARYLAHAYSSFYFQLLILPVVLAVFGFGQRACAMVVAYALLCLVSSVFCIWYPALGTYVVYGVGRDDLVAINAKFGFHFLEQFNAVRAAGPFELTLAKAAGIVTFPSVHAGVAALCAWASWSLRWVRYPMFLLNIGMAVSAVSHANHYLIDVIAGIGIAGLCVSITTSIFYSRCSETLIMLRRKSVHPPQRQVDPAAIL